jgi:hypothetical protein
MILDSQIPELDLYRTVEDTHDVYTRSQWGKYVIFGRNETLPVHNWFRFKEGFSSSLLDQVIAEFGSEIAGTDFTLMDPFCGVGTTLLSAQSSAAKPRRAIGIERNPFIRFVANSKLSWNSMEPGSLASNGRDAIREAANLKSCLPSLSSIRKGRCISKHIAKRLVAIQEACHDFKPNSAFLRLGVAASIDVLSRVRRDGRALRLVSKPRQNVEPVIEQIWERMSADVITLKRAFSDPPRPYAVILGDGRDPKASGIENGSIDLIVTSPPYPNNIDYSEVYKLELWLMGFVTSSSEFLALRHSTLRSHPTYNKTTDACAEFKDEMNSGRLREVLGTLMRRIDQTDEKWRAKLLTAYFEDMWIAIRNFRDCLSKNGTAVLVVGNSLHGTDNPALIATDLVLAQIAECHGMKAEIAIARGLKRRLSGNHFLRESLVIIKKH